MNASIRLCSCIPLIALAADLSFAPNLGLPGGDLAAQAPEHHIVAMVVDESSLEPLEGVLFQLDGANLTGVTDDEGRVVFDGIPTGNVTLRATLAGYGSVVEAVAVTAGEVSLLRYQLPRIDVLLSEILVRGRADADARGGHSEARLRVEAGTPLSVADVLVHGVPGLYMNRTGGLVGGGVSVRIRGPSSLVISNSPAVYLDGVRIDDHAGSLSGSRAFQILETMPARDVRQIRVLRGPAAAARYADSANGVILIETRRGEPNPDGR